MQKFYKKELKMITREELEQREKEQIQNMSVPDILIGILSNWPLGRGGQKLPAVNVPEIHRCLEWVKTKKLEEEVKCQR